jgi:predicted RNA-binding protein YlxR (DUF448 family)
MPKTNKELCKEYYVANSAYIKKQNNLRRKKLTDLAAKNLLPKPTITEKVCTKCKQTLSIDKFSYRKNRGCYESNCKNCRCEKAKLDRVNRATLISSQRRTRHIARKQVDPEYMGARTVRTRIHKLLGQNKNQATDVLVGTTKRWLVRWLKFNLLFDESSGMTWENRSTYWHMDHVVPCNLFNLHDKQEQCICLNWTNIKPMLAHKNISKQDTLLHHQCMEQEIRLKLFEKHYGIEISDSTVQIWMQRRGVSSTAADEKSSVQQEV